jgi:hypothetical protein
MAEIKSTMDLVLEKTRNLTLSSEDKEKLAREELERKVQGLVNRYLDQLIPLSRITEEIEHMRGTEQGLAHRLLKADLLAHLDLDRDNSSILSALKQAAGVDIAFLTHLQDEYQLEKGRARGSFIEKGLARLRKRGISGSSVVPNLGKDSNWTQFLDALREKYEEKLTQVENGQ